MPLRNNPETIKTTHMKNPIFKELKSFFKDLLFVSLALVGLITFYLVAIGATLFKAFFKKTISEGIDYLGLYMVKVAFSLDQTINVVFEALWQYVFVKKDIRTGKRPEYFGNPDETISSALGRLYLSQYRTRFCVIIVKALSLIDKDHAVKSIGN